MNELLEMLSVAVQSQSWLIVVAAAVLLLLSVPIVVLKAINKPVPLLDTLLELGKGLVKVLPKKAPPAPADPSKDGVAAVVKIEDARKGPPAP